MLTALPPLVVVDDDDDDIILLKHLLESAGFRSRILVFTDGAEAIKYFRRVASGGLDRPLACFLDVRMPGYGGFHVLDAVRAMGELDDLCVVMLSSSDEQRDIAAAAGKGAQCYLAKHPSAAVLASVLNDALEFSRRRIEPKTVRSLFAEASNLLPR